MRLSVVVTIVDAGRALDRCLAALEAQQEAPCLEVIVPWDDTVDGVAALANRFPHARFLELGRLPTHRPAHTHAGQHELFDRRRAAGLAAAGGDIIAILEDRGAPEPGWARTMVRLHEELPHAAIGGAVEHAGQRSLQWAVYFCDFHRYQRPFLPGPRAYATDVNIGYKRRALEATAELWRVRYHETVVNGALQRAGEIVYVTPDLAVEQLREQLTLGSLLLERFAWGRLFASTRARAFGALERSVVALATPLLPAVLLGRHVALQLRKRAPAGPFLLAMPFTVLLMSAWSLGEAAGYLAGEA